MRYEDPELLRKLAAEYALGTLDGRARRRFERLLETHPALRAETDFWTQRLGEFGQALPPVPPPPAVRQSLLQRIAPVRRRALRRRRWLWPYAAGFASAAALVLAFLAGQRSADPGTDATLPPAPTRPVAAARALVPAPEFEAGVPIYAAQVRLPTSNMGWLLSITADHRHLIAVAADDFLQLGRYRLQLWSIAPDQTMVPMGSLPVERHATASYEIPATLRGHSQVRFAISLEPLHGPPGNRPSGPVLSEAASMDGI